MAYLLQELDKFFDTLGRWLIIDHILQNQNLLLDFINIEISDQ